VRYLPLALSVAILLTSAACQVHVDGTAPTTRRSPPPLVATHPLLSEVAVIYVDHWGISEPDYLYLSHDLHLSDDDIGVVLFLAARSPWQWRRIAVQRRAGHDWKSITRMAGLTPLVYFVDIPRDAALRHPYEGLYRQYWRYQSQPQRIHLGDADCVAMVRLHLIRERYDYDPVAYMDPGVDRSHHVLLRELESQRRSGMLQAAPPPRPLAHEASPGKERRVSGAVGVGHGAAAERDRASGDHRAVRRGSVAHGTGQSPATPGHAVSRSAGPPPGRGATASRVRTTPPGRSENDHLAGHDRDRGTEPSRVKGTTRARLADKGPRQERGAAGAANAAAEDESTPVAKGDVRGTKAPKTAAARDRGTSTARKSSPPSTAATAAAHQDAAAGHPAQGTETDVSPAAPRNHAPETPVVTKNRQVRGGPSTAHAVTHTPTPTADEAADGSGSAKGKARVTAKEAVARTHGNHDEAAVEPAVAAKSRDKDHAASQPQPRQSDEDVAQDDAGADTPFADADADDPEPVSRRGAAGGDHSRGRP